MGMGCPNCKRLYAAVQEAVKELGIEAEVIYVTDIQEIMKVGIMRTPGLVIDGKVKAAGQIPALQELKQMVQDEA